MRIVNSKVGIRIEFGLILVKKYSSNGFVINNRDLIRLFNKIFIVYGRIIRVRISIIDFSSVISGCIVEFFWDGIVVLLRRLDKEKKYRQYEL